MVTLCGMSSKSNEQSSNFPAEATVRERSAAKSRRFLALESLKIANYRFLFTADYGVQYPTGGAVLGGS